MRIRILKKYGNSYAIKLNHDDLNDFKIKEGSRIDIDDIVPLEQNDAESKN